MTSLPLHLQISEMLVREIKAGIRIDGDRLPPERGLCKELGVSIGTLRKALADLSEKGMLDRVHGSGNYVRNNPDVDNIYALFRLELTSGGGFPTAQLLSVLRKRRPQHVPMIDSADHAFRFRRIRSLDQIEIAAEEMWLGGDRAVQIAEKDVGDSLYQFYRDKLGFRITRVVDRVSAAPLPRWARLKLDVPKTQTWGYVERISQDEHGHTAEFSRTWFNTELAQFVAR